MQIAFQKITLVIFVAFIQNYGMDETREEKISSLTREALETLSHNELVELVLRQTKIIGIQAEQISRLAEKVAALEERLGMNSRN